LRRIHPLSQRAAGRPPTALLFVWSFPPQSNGDAERGRPDWSPLLFNTAERGRNPEICGRWTVADTFRPPLSAVASVVYSVFGRCGRSTSLRRAGKAAEGIINDYILSLYFSLVLLLLFSGHWPFLPSAPSVFGRNLSDNRRLRGGRSRPLSVHRPLFTMIWQPLPVFFTRFTERKQP
jgi:hypothetical protein